MALHSAALPRTVAWPRALRDGRSSPALECSGGDWCSHDWRCSLRTRLGKKAARATRPWPPDRISKGQRVATRRRFRIDRWIGLQWDVAFRILAADQQLWSVNTR